MKPPALAFTRSLAPAPVERSMPRRIHRPRVTLIHASAAMFVAQALAWAGLVRWPDLLIRGVAGVFGEAAIDVAYAALVRAPWMLAGAAAVGLVAAIAAWLRRRSAARSAGRGWAACLAAVHFAVLGAAIALRLA